jgi:hypothetical protein
MKKSIKTSLITSALSLLCASTITNANTFFSVGHGHTVYTINAQLPINKVTDFERINIYMSRWSNNRCGQLRLTGQQLPISYAKSLQSIRFNPFSGHSQFTYRVKSDAIQLFEANRYNPPTISPLCLQYELCANGECYKTPVLKATLTPQGYTINSAIKKAMFVID